MANVDKTFGAISTASAGFSRSAFDPDQWLESLTRGIKSYVNRYAPGVYDIRMEFPSADQINDFPQLPKTIIHFEVDDVGNDPLGMGDSWVDERYDDTPSAETVTYIEGIPHEVSFDVGIWASPISGGTTSRMRAYQLLTKLFVGSIAYNKFLTEEDIEILEFQGGSFVQETINDLPVFRAIGITLQTRVFERRENIELPQITEILQDQSALTL